jgi:regulator of sigma E protease
MIGNILLVAIVIAVLIFIHELGHLLACKVSHIKVETFSLGFGPALVKWKWAETTYKVSALPLGGYIKMEGEDYGATGFFTEPLGKKVLVMVSGPSSNLILGAVLFAVMFGVFGVRKAEPRIDVDPGSRAAVAGMAKGDLVLRINGDTIFSYDDIDQRLAKPESASLAFRLRRGSLDTTIQLYGVGDSLGVKEFSLAGIVSVNPGWPAEGAGFKPGDMLLSVDTAAIADAEQFTRVVRASVGKQLSIRVLREHETLTKTVEPRSVPDTVPGGVIGQIGIGLGDGALTSRVRVTVPRAGWEAIKYAGTVVVKTFEVLYELVTGKISARAVSGPVMVGKILYEGVQSGAEMLLAIWALISINLFVVNLLPVPFLDGGRAVLFIVEGIRGKPLSAKAWDVALRIGLHLVVLLAIFALSNDFLNLINLSGRFGTSGSNIQLMLVFAYFAYSVFDIVRPQPPVKKDSGDQNEPKE